MHQVTGASLEGGGAEAAREGACWGYLGHATVFTFTNLSEKKLVEKVHKQDIFHKKKHLFRFVSLRWGLWYLIFTAIFHAQWRVVHKACSGGSHACLIDIAI